MNICQDPNYNNHSYRRRKSKRVLVTELLMSKAKKLMANGKSKRAAAREIGISESSLRKRLRLGTIASSMGRWKPTFNEAQEAKFLIHCMEMHERYFGLTITNLRRLAYEYATVNKIENRFDSSCKMAGRHWLQSFLKRHPELTLSQSSATSISQTGFNKAQVDNFYKNLNELYKRHNFKPNRIFNVDETGINIDPKNTLEVKSMKENTERGITVTAICCMSASGHYVPPAFIYPRKGPRDDLLNGAPSQSICMVPDSGIVNTDMFIAWLGHFQYIVHPKSEDPVLLLLDNHSSHISLEAVNFARKHNIIMLTLPPHGRHKIQPLCTSFFISLKAKYSTECNKFKSEFPGKTITQYDVARLFNKAYKKVATFENAESGFKGSGIYPFDDGLFSEEDFAPSSVTEHDEQNVHGTQNESSEENE